jgi:hypothetical protein
VTAPAPRARILLSTALDRWDEVQDGALFLRPAEGVVVELSPAAAVGGARARP